jgi:ERCC4-type nuclease
MSEACLIRLPAIASATPAPAPASQAKPQEPRIRLDMRETGLRGALSVNPPTAALPVGDVWIGCDGDQVAANGIILERKTVADFDASIKDGRYDEQRGRMLAYAQERGAKVAYVVEGHLEKSSLGPVALVKKIAHAEFNHGIPVFRTFSQAETARLCEALLAMWVDGKFSADAGAGRAQRAADGIHIVKRANSEDPHQFALQIICQCPGLSVKAAEALLAEFGSLRGVLAAEEAAIAAVKVGASNRRLGPAVAGRFCTLFADMR